jgi:arylsulfatase A-like enzyme
MQRAPRGLPNVVIVTVDCLRRDRLSAYGYHRQTTPFLDGLLDRSLHCTSAHSTSSWTCPSVASILTGLYPHRHGGGLVPGEPKNLSKTNLPTTLPPDVPTLPGVLAGLGYATAAIGAVWNAHLSIPHLFQQMDMVEQPGPRLVRRAVRWIRDQDGPFLLWLHLGDAHEPLDIPRRMREFFGKVPRIRRVRKWDYTRSGAAVSSPAFNRYREARVRLYDVAVRAADEAIGEMWSALASVGLQDRTMLFVTSDHGEEFWEHRDEEMEGFTDPRDVYGTGHGHNLFQVHVLVPLVMFGAGVAARVIGENVTLADLLPTTLEVLGVDSPPTDGVSLLGTLRPRPILSEGIAYGYEKKSVVMDDLKLISAPGDGYERAFRLGADRREAERIEDTPTIRMLREHLPSEQIRLGEQIEPTREIEAHLRTLGYIE